MSSAAGHDSNSKPGYELRDISIGPVVWSGIAIIATVLVFSALMWGMYTMLGKREAGLSEPPHPMAATRARTQPPAPRLQPRPIDDLLILHAWEDEILGSYGWVDRADGKVRIPIERAMELTAERGLPASAPEARR